jgi:hypothetical protein
MIRYSSKVVRDEVASAQSTCLLDVPLTRRRVGSLIAIASPPRMSADHQRFRGAAVSAGQELQGAALLAVAVPESPAHAAAITMEARVASECVPSRLVASFKMFPNLAAASGSCGAAACKDGGPPGLARTMTPAPGRRVSHTCCAACGNCTGARNDLRPYRDHTINRRADAIFSRGLALSGS